MKTVFVALGILLLCGCSTSSGRLSVIVPAGVTIKNSDWNTVLSNTTLRARTQRRFCCLCRSDSQVSTLPSMMRCKKAADRF